MAVGRIRHGVVVTADVRENRPKMKLGNNQVFGNAISFPDGLLEAVFTIRWPRVLQPGRCMRLGAVTG